MFQFNFLIPDTGMVFPFPKLFHLLETLQERSSPQAMQTLSEGPGASFSKTENQTTVKSSPELGLNALQKENLLRVQTVNLTKET